MLAAETATAAMFRSLGLLVPASGLSPAPPEGEVTVDGPPRTSQTQAHGTVIEWRTTPIPADTAVPEVFAAAMSQLEDAAYDDGVPAQAVWDPQDTLDFARFKYPTADAYVLKLRVLDWDPDTGTSLEVQIIVAEAALVEQPEITLITDIQPSDVEIQTPKAEDFTWDREEFVFPEIEEGSDWRGDAYEEPEPDQGGGTGGSSSGNDSGSGGSGEYFDDASEDDRIGGGKSRRYKGRNSDELKEALGGVPESDEPDDICWWCGWYELAPGFYLRGPEWSAPFTPGWF